jgi:hypothetical protein
MRSLANSDLSARAVMMTRKTAMNDRGEWLVWCVMVVAAIVVCLDVFYWRP